jgi:mRNA-degrading endonuclease YafQ of YafQ-DinJ toxin-antitoxin module
MKWFLFYVVSVSATIVKVIICRCDKVEQKMQSLIDFVEHNKTHSIHYKSHSLTYNSMGYCMTAITFDTPRLINYPFEQ